MTEPANNPEVRELDADAAAADAERFLRDFCHRMAEQGLIVQMANAGPDWEPGITLDIPGDELSAMVVRLRGERARGV